MNDFHDSPPEKFSLRERLYRKVHGVWPQSVVDRRLAEDDARRDRWRSPPVKTSPVHPMYGSQVDQPLLPPGVYNVCVLDFRPYVSRSGRELVCLTCEVLDMAYRGVLLFKYLPTDPGAVERTRWVWEGAFAEMTREETVGQHRLLDVQRDSWNNVERNMPGKFRHVPEHLYEIDMNLEFLFGPPVKGSNNPVVTTAMQEAVEAAHQVLRKHGCTPTHTGYGSLYRGKAGKDGKPEQLGPCST